MHVVVCVTGETFVVVGPFETGRSAERWKERKESEGMSSDLGTRYHVVLLVLPRIRADA